MPITKEQLEKVVSKNYSEVQKKEFEVYDQFDKVVKLFDKNTKAQSTSLTKENKAFEAEDKKIVLSHQQLVVELKEKEKAHQVDITARQTEGASVFEAAIKENKLAESKAVKGVATKVKKINKDNDLLIKQLLEEYNALIETSNKKIEVINEKTVKDNKAFEQKLEDLASKQNANMTTIKEQEEAKYLQLKEASNKEIEDLQKEILAKREELDKKLSILKPVYEAELEEIDENIKEAKDEHDEKYNSIKTSSEQRITVREKHLNRAEADGDKKSVKAHTKDIAKFKKEAIKDLALLKKKYEQDSIASLDYRKSFIKENIEKLADLERAYAKVRENLQLSIDSAVIKLKTDLECTKAEFEELQAVELYNYQSLEANTKQKQLEFGKESKHNIELELNTQEESKINFDNDNFVNVEKHKEQLEITEKELRDIEIVKTRDDALAKNIIDVLTANLQNESVIAKAELEKDIKVDVESEKNDHHQVQHKRHTAMQSEFYQYQQTLEPLYLDRAASLLEYSLLEIENRYNLKETGLEKARKEIERDYKKVLEKIESVYIDEVAFVSKEADRFGSNLKEEFAVFVTEGETKLQALQLEVNKFDPRKEKRERKAKQDEFDSAKNEFDSAKSDKTYELERLIGAYETSAKDALNRKNKALEDSETLYNLEISQLDNELQVLADSKSNEVNAAQERHDATVSNVQQFLSEASRRNDDEGASHQAYLDNRLSYQNDIIYSINQAFEAYKNEEAQKLSSLLSSLESDKQNTINTSESNLALQEQKLAEFKSETEGRIASINSKRESDLSDQKAAYQAKLNAIDQDIVVKIDDIHQDLKEKELVLQEVKADVKSRVQAEVSRYEIELKRVKAEYEVRLKEDLERIDIKEKEDVANIE